MVRPFTRGRKRERSKQNEDLQEERPAKVTKKQNTKQKKLANADTVGASHDGMSSDNRLPSEPKAGVTPTVTRTPRAITKKQSVAVPAGAQPQTTLPMVSPEMNSVPLPPFMRANGISKASLSAARAEEPNALDLNEQEEMVVEEQTTASENGRRKEKEAVQYRQEEEEELSCSTVDTLLGKVTAVLVLMWAFVVGVFESPKITTSPPAAGDSTAQSTQMSVWKRVKEVSKQYINEERGIAKEWNVQIEKVLTAVKEKSLSAMAAIQQKYHDGKGVFSQIKARMVAKSTAILESLKLNGNKTLAKEHHWNVRRIVPIFIVACLYMIQLQWNTLINNDSNIQNNKQDHNETRTMWLSGDGPNPAAVNSRNTSPIGLAYVTQQLISPEDENNKKTRKRKLMADMKEEPVVACGEVFEEEVDERQKFLKEEPSLEPTIEISDGMSYFDFKANPSPIGLAYVTQKLLEMDN